MIIDTAQLAQLEDRCSRLARALDASESDEITLLRAARTLKRVNVDLRRAVWHRAGAPGGVSVANAEGGLEVMEQHLRSVLLADPLVEPYQIRIHLLHALDQSFDTIDLLR